MRLGILGGSFNPVHGGHLLLAEWCREAAELDRVWFMPAAIAPHKQRREAASGDDRVAMLELATADNPAFQVSRLELERGGVSYTVDTLTEIRRQQPTAELFLLMGADTLADLPNWRSPDEVCRLATPLVVRRFGLPEPNFSVLKDLVPSAQLESIRALRVEMPLVDFSSSEIRRRRAAGQSIRYQTPPEVIAYLEQQGLYL